MTLWIYQRIAPGIFRQIPLKTFEEWFSGRASLPPGDDGFVWLAQLTVSMLNRQAVKIENVHFTKSRVNAEGVHEEEMRREEQRAELDALEPIWARMFGEKSPGTPGIPNPTGDAFHRFARDQYRWTPTQTDADALQSIVNKRAGRVIMNLRIPEDDRAATGKSEALRPAQQREELMTDATRSKSREPPIRTPRPFIAANVPAPFTASDSRESPEQTLARREKAVQEHHALLVALHQSLEGAGWMDIQEIPDSVDLWARSPIDGRRVIFEAKTLNAENERDQTRTALAQLLEYRHFDGEHDDRLCLVTNGIISDARQRFLATLGIAVITYDGTAFHSVGTLAGEWFGELPHASS